MRLSLLCLVVSRELVITCVCVCCECVLLFRAQTEPFALVKTPATKKVRNTHTLHYICAWVTNVRVCVCVQLSSACLLYVSCACSHRNYEQMEQSQVCV